MSELLTRPELADIFKVSLPTIHRWEKLGKLHAVRLGAGSVRYRREEVDAFLERAGK